MKKILIISLLVMLYIIPSGYCESMSDRVIRLSSSGTSVTIDNDGTTTIYSEAIEVKRDELMSIWIIASDNESSTIDVDVDFEVSHQAPATEYASDTYYSVPAWSSSYGYGTVVDGEHDDPINDTTYHTYPIITAGTCYWRLKITNQATDSDIKLNAGVTAWGAE